MPNTNRITQLEEHVTHQQRLLAELDEVVTQQRNELDQFKKEFHAMVVQVKGILSNNASGEDLPHEKPPHY